jgi:hypothetical protein
MISDLIQNAVESGASVINVDVSESDTNLAFVIHDNGKGMSPEILARAKDPFYTDGIKHPVRKVGLGIPFLMQTAEETGGFWDIVSKEHEGTTVSGTFDKTNIDTPPVGLVSGMFRQALTQSGSFEMIISRKNTGKAGSDSVEYQISKSELTDALGELETVDSLALLEQYLSGLETVDETEG